MRMPRWWKNNRPNNPTLLLAVRVACGVLLGQTVLGQALLGQTLWTGSTTGGTLTWHADNVTIARGGGMVYSERDTLLRLWDADFKEFASVDNDFPEDSVWCEYGRKVGVLSFVGNYVSLRRSTYANCLYLAHPMLQTDYAVINAANPGQPVTLTDLFPEADLLKALLADPLVKQALAERGVRRNPQKLQQLVASLNEWSGKCEYYFPEDFLSRFAFHHLEGKKVAVRIGLPHGCEAARGNLTELGILLPVPSALRTALQAANSGKQGFLVKNKPKGKMETTISARHAQAKR